MKTSLLFLALFSVSNLIGQIVFVNNFDGVYPYGNDVWDFDINNDGEMDISFNQVGNNPQNYFLGKTNVYGQNKVQTEDNIDDFTIDCSNDTINVFTSYWNSKAFLWYEDIQLDIDVGNHKQAFRLIAINPANNQSGFLYGYIDYTMLETRDVIIHGWYYESSFNQPIIVGQEPSTNLTEINSDKNLVQILDLMGRETTFKPNTLLIYVYDDGSTEKVFKTE